VEGFNSDFKGLKVFNFFNFNTIYIKLFGFRASFVTEFEEKCCTAINQREQKNKDSNDISTRLLFYSVA
jgi:hypothetical protein